MRRVALASLALALSLGGASAVNAQENPQPRRPRAEGEFRGQRGPGGPAGLLLRGIELSDAQKEQVKAIIEKRRPSREQMEQARERAGEARERAGQARERVREQRQEGAPRDTAAMRQRREQAMQRMLQERAELNREIRSVLTREQQAQFDKNVAEMNARMQERMQGRGERRESAERRDVRRRHPAGHR